jgi:hypothetical protein
MKHNKVTPNSNHQAMIKHKKHEAKTPHISDIGAEWI